MSMNDELKKELIEFLKDCRPDMHEPDEQGVSALVIGDHLDNAVGNFTSEDAIINGYQEYVVILKKTNGAKLFVNLANLIALARENVYDSNL